MSRVAIEGCPIGEKVCVDENGDLQTPPREAPCEETGQTMSLTNNSWEDPVRRAVCLNGKRCAEILALLKDKKV